MEWQEAQRRLNELLAESADIEEEQARITARKRAIGEESRAVMGIIAAALGAAPGSSDGNDPATPMTGGAIGGAMSVAIGLVAGRAAPPPSEPASLPSEVRRALEQLSQNFERPLKHRVIAHMATGTPGQRFHVTEVAQAVRAEEETEKQVDICMRDAHAKSGLLDKPHGTERIYVLNDSGRQEAARLVSG